MEFLSFSFMQSAPSLSSQQWWSRTIITFTFSESSMRDCHSFFISDKSPLRPWHSSCLWSVLPLRCWPPSSYALPQHSFILSPPFSSPNQPRLKSMKRRPMYNNNVIFFFYSNWYLAVLCSPPFSFAFQPASSVHWKNCINIDIFLSLVTKKINACQAIPMPSPNKDIFSSKQFFPPSYQAVPSCQLSNSFLPIYFYIDGLSQWIIYKVNWKQIPNPKCRFLINIHTMFR